MFPIARARDWYKLLCVTSAFFSRLQEILANDDDGTCGNGLASRITYTPDCTEYSSVYHLRNGCYGTKACSAQVLISVSGSGCTPTASVTPTASPSFASQCGAYSFSTTTDSATTQYQLCPVLLYGGFTYSFYTCGTTAEDTYVRLWSPGNAAV
jgi:hypothetical protein